jgi:molybdate transport repressor ModE-like protein
MTFHSGIVDAIGPQRLRLLVEVQRRGSISAAAEVCRLSQPSATKHLKALEAAVGDRLVQRNGRASSLTEAGEIVAAHALQVLDEIESMQDELHALREAERGTLRLGASTTAGSYVLPSILNCFADKHPRVDVDVVIGSSSWVAERVALREVSLGLAGEVDFPAEVTAERFLDDELTGIAAPGLLKRKNGRATREQLADHTFLVRELGSSTRLVAERELERLGLEPAKRWEFDSDEAIKRSVQAGLGVGFVSGLVVEDELERGELETFKIEGSKGMSRSIQLLRPTRREMTPSERAFVQTLCSCCSVSVAGCTAGSAQAG